MPPARAAGNVDPIPRFPGNSRSDYKLGLNFSTVVSADENS